MQTCKTVRVKAQNEQGFIIINETDFDAEQHEHFDEHESDPDKPVTAAMLRDALDARGIKYKPQASKAQLQALLDEAVANDK